MRIGESQVRILERLKRGGADTIPTLAEALGLNVETVRSHLKDLTSAGLVRREGRRIRGRGRPEIVYGLAEAADAHFPSQEAELLAELALFLRDDGQAGLLRSFFEERARRRREAVLPRLEGLEGPERLEEVVRILSEEGYMPEVGEDASGRSTLALTHCPLRGVVDVTRAPCRAELGFVRDLLDADLERVSYIPSGEASCCYALKAG
ncbi:MAG: helix-turn-helix domain-containing protein [Longimicrobiales bacterium]